MGESITKDHFDQIDYDTFLKKMRQESLTLKKLFDERRFEFNETSSLGLEVEAWLVDKDSIPTPSNTIFINTCADKNIVEEISKYNFEINTEPTKLEAGAFDKVHKELKETWALCKKTAASLDIEPLTIGIHPLIRDPMLQPEFLSEAKRYKVLNDQIFKMRQDQPLHIDIKGRDHLELELNHILLEAAATSIQIHLQSNQEDFKRLYNASLIAAAPTVALAANSPYLYGQELWEESRIAVFEQAIALKQFRNKKGHNVGRVTMGTSYVKHSALELFIENLDAYPPLVPLTFDEAPEQLHHIRFHNGTIWRWVRPILGMGLKDSTHLRIEQRVMASGPTLIDIIANTAFSVGLTTYFAKNEKAPEESMTFTDTCSNFYRAAQKGLSSQVRWFGKEKAMDQLLLEDLIPKAKKGLKQIGISSNEIKTYIDDVIYPRVLKGQNGARWQRSFVKIHGKDFQSLIKEYMRFQKSEVPVHEWKV